MEWKTFAAWEPLEAFVEQQGRQIGVPCEYHSEQVVTLALEPVGSTPDVNRCGDRRLIRRHVGLDHQFMPDVQREQMVIDFESVFVIYDGNATEVVEVEPGIIS